MTAPAMEMERVIRRFTPVTTDLTPMIDRGDILGLYCDTESTGKDPDKDQIVQVSLVSFTFTPDGEVTGIGEAYTALEDPGIPIPPEATKVHGITDAMVSRKRIVDGDVNQIVAGSAIVVAHYSDYDRKILERRFPVFEGARWGCSYQDVPWRDQGYECAKLRCLLLEHCSLDFDNHGADTDAQAGLHLLTTGLPSGKRALSYVLDAMRVSHVRVCAIDSPFQYKDVLKDNDYEAHYVAEKFQYWFKDVKVGEEFVAEKEFLATKALCHSPKCIQFDSRRRFSNRIGKG